MSLLDKISTRYLPLNELDYEREREREKGVGRLDQVSRGQSVSSKSWRLEKKNFEHLAVPDHASINTGRQYLKT